jgi:hypothetical protein
MRRVDGKGMRQAALCWELVAPVSRRAINSSYSQVPILSVTETQAGRMNAGAG